MGTSEGNYKRRKNGFYDDTQRKKKWAKNIRKNTEIRKINTHEKVENQLDEINYNLLENLKTKTYKEIQEELKKDYKIKNNKLALKKLRERNDENLLNEVIKKRKNKNISKGLIKTLNENPDIRLIFIKNMTSHNGKKYRSKGESRLKNWLVDNYPEYDWRTKHLIWNNEGFEFDIYSHKYDDYYIEYNGIIHYKKLYDEQKFEEIKRKDKLKQRLTKQLDKKFIIIKDSQDWESQKHDIINFII